MMQGHYQLKENYIHTSLYRRLLRYPPHFQSTIEVVYMRQGHSTALIDDREYRLGPDDLLIIFPHKVHGFRDDDSPDCMLMFIPLSYTATFRDTFCHMTPADPILHNASRFPRMIELFYHISEARRSKYPHTNEILCGYITAFLGQLLDQLTLKPAEDINFGIVQNILHYCSSHYRESLTLSQLADAMYMHRSQVSAIFSKQLHISFNDYINSLRVEEARRLLRNTEDTITAISITVGFDSTRTFNRAFQRFAGMTPRQYRQAKRGK